MENDFPKYSLNIKPEMDWEAERLQFTTTIDGISKQIHRESVCFKEKAVRTTLIALGWTPPEGMPDFAGQIAQIREDFPQWLADNLCKATPPQIIKLNEKEKE